MIEAFAHYHLESRGEKRFQCPSDRCTIQFDEVTGWFAHAGDVHCHEWKKFEILPAQLRLAFEERVAWQKRTSESIEIQYLELSGKWVACEQEEVRRAWIEQLDSTSTREFQNQAQEDML